jgi:hypothetical protein
VGPVVVVGLDVGQKRDPTALAVVEIVERETGRVFHAKHAHLYDDCLDPVGRELGCRAERHDVFVVRDLGRLPLGTPYPVVGERVVEVIERLNQRRLHTAPRLVVDATGVGTPVVDILRSALREVRCDLTEATFVHGEMYEGGWAASKARVGKAYLVSRLQALLATGRIKLPKSRSARQLARELEDYEIRVDEAARLTAGAFRTGAHDDLVTALGLAVLDDWSGQRVFVGADPWG